VKYLTVEQILFIHSRLIGETGGSWALRDLGLLQSAVARPQASFEDQELYPTLFSKAAALMESIVRNHPFVDGNKRTGITSAAMFLALNGRRLTCSEAELERFTFQAAKGELTLDQMANWFEKNAK